MVGVEYRCITWRFKIAHTYTFLTKNFYGFETVFCIMVFGIFSMFLCVLCRAKILPQIYTRIIASLKPPPYTRIICEKNFAPRYIYNNCGAVRICERLIERWYLCVRFVSCFICVVIVWIRSFLLLIGWCQSLVIKAWLDCINSL